MITHICGDTIKSTTSVGGGCIGSSSVLTGHSGQKYFYKSYDRPGLAEAEATGLAELSKANAITVPKVYEATPSYLVLEYFPTSSSTPKAQINLGQNLAKLHQYHTEKSGFLTDNFIGLSPQINTSTDSWANFYLTHRLGFQIELAQKNGHLTDELKTSYTNALPEIRKQLEAVIEPMSLLHGDLWGGNYIITEDDTPVLIDPAVYYGHREADLAMTYIFGGFSEEFYRSYNREFPLENGWKKRLNMYKLYHILNHLNLFGASYLSQALSLLRSYQ